MKSLTFRVLLTSVLCFVFSAIASAVPVTINIEATVTQVVDHGLNGGWLGGQVKVNDVITGHYTYESTTADTDPATNSGRYPQQGAPSCIFLSVSGLTFQSNPNNLDLTVALGWSPQGAGYTIESMSNLPFSGGQPIARLSWALQDFTATALTSDALPTTAPVLSNWQDGNLLRIDGSPTRGGFGIDAIVTKAEVIPEPATLLLLAGGTLCFGKRFRKM